MSITQEQLAIRRLHTCWKDMRYRCLNPNHRDYRFYGGRGIKVCDRWLGKNGCDNFIKDMGLRPTPQHTLDRINSDGDYNKKNCRWATRHVQSINRRMFKKNTSGTTGVYWNVTNKRWTASIRAEGRLLNLGSFIIKDKAVIARKEAEKLYYKPIMDLL